MTKIKIGFGHDVHKLVVGRDLWLGGVKIPHTKGALGHSDADVLIHAICDAMLGALSLGDIGYHYPDTDPKWKDIDSKILLLDVVKMIHSNGYRVGNVDSMVCLQRPKIRPFVSQMKMVLSQIIGIEVNDVSIKATTNEEMGFVGREEGVTAQAVVLLIKMD